MRSHKLRMPTMGMELPIRFRFYFVAFTMLIMFLLAVLNLSLHEWPVNDKIVHFTFLGLSTCLFYFVFDVDEEARRVWMWRHMPLILTGVTCVFFGSIFSEVVQTLFVPESGLDWGHIFANTLGSLAGLAIAYNFERYYRSRREIARLYRPLDSSYAEEEPDSDEDELLNNYQNVSSTKGRTTRRVGDVWDSNVSRDALFELGDDEDEDDEVLEEGRRRNGAPLTPRIAITPAS